MSASILWRRLDVPGHDYARLTRTTHGWRLDGTATFLEGAQPCRVDYEISCDDAWRTRMGRVGGWLGEERVEALVEADADLAWRLNGESCPAVRGAVDLDLAFSPATNLLPIRRLGLDVGRSAHARAAWLRLPGPALEPLDQVYLRLSASRYRYETTDGEFAVKLQVDGRGFVTRYPSRWVCEGLGERGSPPGHAAAR